MLKNGFLATQAPFAADLVLILEMAMAFALLLGGWLARKKRFREHARIQSAIVLMNLFVIGASMLPSFRILVLPRIPDRMGNLSVAAAALHATLGSVTEVAGIYILLSAGTSVLPKTLRITRYKTPMRTVLLLWWITLLLGIATYARWYVPGLFRK